ncbi:hypothetical protein QVA66_04185 [Staphylococcus chromogenes]|nr:hypothetical protein [Staphylococcus chromogenes]
MRDWQDELLGVLVDHREGDVVVVVAAVLNAVAGKLAGLPATKALNRGDFDAATAVYDSVLAQETAN